MNQLMYAAREQQDQGFILGMDQFIEYIESINSQKIIECATKWLNPETLSEIIYLPENQKR
jgi:predicted Zn-dependent peptidase